MSHLAHARWIVRPGLDRLFPLGLHFLSVTNNSIEIVGVAIGWSDDPLLMLVEYSAMKHVIALLLLMQLVAIPNPDQAAKEENEKRGKMAAEVACLTVDASPLSKGGGDEKANERMSDLFSEKLQLGEADQAKLRPIVRDDLTRMMADFLKDCYAKAFLATFSTEELSGILNFYKSDSGKAFLARQSDSKPLSPEDELGALEFYKSEPGKAILAKRQAFGGTFEEIRKASTKDLHQKMIERIRKEAPELLEKGKAEQGAP